MCEEVECESYHDLPPACHCAFASCNVNCQVEDSFIEYVQEALCNTGHWEWVEIRSTKSILFYEFKPLLANFWEISQAVLLENSSIKES